MRVLLKKGNKFYSIYYIKRRSGNNCIVGWFSEKRLLPKIFPEINVLESDIHFTYFADGNYHISLKYSDDSSDKIERRLFFDKIVIKNITKKTTQILPKTANSVFEGHLVPDFKPHPFSDTYLFFQTVTTGFNLSGEWLHRWFDNPLEQGTTPKKEDIIVDIEEERNFGINVSALLTGSDYVHPPITNPQFTIDKMLTLEDKRISPYIRLQVIFNQTKTE